MRSCIIGKDNKLDDKYLKSDDSEEPISRFLSDNFIPKNMTVALREIIEPTDQTFDKTFNSTMNKLETKSHKSYRSNLSARKSPLAH